MTEFLLYLYAESPVHAGAAESVDLLDLPVQREVTTGYPVIWGQSLKGALRQTARENWQGDDAKLVTQVFGSEVGAGGETETGQLNVGDAQLVAMPVPTLRSTFAWVTSPIALARLARKYTALGRRHPAPPSVPDAAPDVVRAAADTWATAEEAIGPYVAEVEGATPELAAWAERLATDALGEDPGMGPFAAKLRTDLLLAGADLMPGLVRECTEQSVRIQLTENKTAKGGALFYSEYLPTETLLACSLSLRRPADTERVHDQLTALLHGQLLRIGGDETIGKGLMWGRLLKGGRS